MKKHICNHLAQQLIQKYISTIALFSLIYDSSYACKFEGLIASCHKNVGGIPLQISARINHCHSPLDISFLIKSPRHYRLGDRNEPLYWEHTYVTTNHEESREIPGFDKRIFFCLHAEEKKEDIFKGPTIELVAYFRMDEEKSESIDLIRDNVTIFNSDECLYAGEDNHITKIAITMSVIVIILFLSCVSACVFHKHRKLKQQRMKDEDRQNLVKNMVPQSKSRFKSKKIKRSASSGTENIKYVVPKDKSTDELHELQIYVSTTTGLEKIDFSSRPGKKMESDVVQEENEEKA
uniref:Uncharacterized protein n=1 Tax=Lepeophtheirus salmonis TaxID=72036 RepID=A0A0K2TCM2_LEPSM